MLRNHIMLGNNLDTLKTLPSCSVDCCVTSPPYYGLRDYGTATWIGGDPKCDHLGEPMRTRANVNKNTKTGTDKKNTENCQFYRDVCGKCGAVRNDIQIGLENTPQEYIKKLVDVFREVKRVLKDDGTLFIVIGDSYFSNTQSVRPYGISDTEPEGCQENDYLYKSLCDECREESRRISHNDYLLASRLLFSFALSNREHKDIENYHFSTSDLMNRAVRILNAFRQIDFSQASLVDVVGVFQVSTIDEFSLRLLVFWLQELNRDVCPLCAYSLGHDVQHSAHISDELKELLRHIQGIALRDVLQTFRNLYKDTAYEYYNENESFGNTPLYIQPYCTTNIDRSQQKIKPKDLVGIPWMLAFALRDDGWWLRQDIVWAKKNPMPESVTDRCTKSHEYIFLLSKSAKYYFDSEAIKETALSPPESRDRANENANITTPNGTARFSHGTREYTKDGKRNKRDVWTVSTEPLTIAHFATFPQKLILPCILSGCPENGIVLDPFMGSGTTAIVALKNFRQYIGCEINPDFIKIAEARIANERGLWDE